MIRDFEDKDVAAFLHLNETYVHWLSPLDAGGLQYILNRATYARCAVDPQTDEMIAGLIAYPHDVDYPGHWNIAWLRQTLDAFFYIDRVVVSGAAHGQGVGKRLYADLSRFASNQGFPVIACEVNTRPDNPGSHTFHQRQGFRAIGEQTFPEKDKVVRYYAKKL